MGIMQLLNIILCGILFGLLGAHFAKKRGRPPLKWFWIVFFLGIFGFMALLFLPKERQKRRLVNQPLKPVFPKRSEAWLKMWYYLDPSHTQQGPLEFPDFIKKVKEKGVTETSYIWGEGMQEWKRLSELPDLIQEIEKA